MKIQNVLDSASRGQIKIQKGIASRSANWEGYNEIFCCKYLNSPREDLTFHFLLSFG